MNIKDLSTIQQHYLIGKAENRDVFIKNNSCWIYTSAYNEIKIYLPDINSMIITNGISSVCVLSNNILTSNSWTAHIENRFSITCPRYEDAIKLCFIASKFGNEVYMDTI